MRVTIIFIIIVALLFVVFANAIDMTNQTFDETIELVGITALVLATFGGKHKG